jgi:SNF2 family DNA or RNA helicase
MSDKPEITLEEAFAKRILVPFQSKGETFLATHKRAGCFMYMGFGKTPVTCRALMDNGCRKIVSIVPENAIKVWSGDAIRWMRDRNTELGIDIPIHFHILDDESWNRKLTWNMQTNPNEVNVFIVVYNTFAKDFGISSMKKGKQTRVLERIIKTGKWDAIVCDEARRLRNKDKSLFKAVAQFQTEYSPPCFYPLTGTPTSKGPRHFWSMLYLIDRRRFSSYWKFVMHFHHVERNAHGGLDIGEPRNLEEFHELLSQYAYVVPADDPEASKQLPKKRRQLLNFTMSPDQQRLYREITEDMMADMGDDVLIASNSLTKMLRLRQILICPQMLSPHLDVGGALMDFVDRAKEEELEPPYVIFTPFTKAFDPFKRYLHDKLTPHVFTLQGGMGHVAQENAIAGWRQTNGTMLVSVEYAEAYSLEPALQSFFIGYHPDPNINDQAESRLQRFTTRISSMHNYYTAGTAIDYRMADIVTQKREYIDMSVPANIRMLFQGGQS